MFRSFHVLFRGLLLGALTSCSAGLSPSGGLITRLHDRGPVLLSPDNPYIVGNLVLAREMERSPVLRGFIAHRGPPPALEVTRSLFAPYKLMLYYPEKPEQFTFEEAGDEWIIDGPVPIDREKLKELTLLTRGVTGGSAQLLTGAELAESAEHGTEESESTNSAPERPFEERTEESPRPITGFQSPAGIAPLGGAQTERELVARSSAEGAHPAEITAKGDLVHYVTMKGESLSIIARWYTYDRSNASRLARINGIQDPNSVTIGDTIIVPAYLVRNKNRLTPEGLELMKAAAVEEKAGNAGRR